MTMMIKLVCYETATHTNRELGLLTFNFPLVSATAATVVGVITERQRPIGASVAPSRAGCSVALALTRSLGFAEADSAARAFLVLTHFQSRYTSFERPYHINEVCTMLQQSADGLRILLRHDDSKKESDLISTGDD
jgi:hypothetical protein